VVENRNQNSRNLTPQQRKKHHQMLIQEEFQAWMSLDQTSRLFQYLRKFKEDLKTQWSRKIFDDSVSNAAALSQIEFIDRLLKITAVEIEEILDDDAECELEPEPEPGEEPGVPT